MNLKEKTVVIDNKTYRYSKIVMLSTKDKTNNLKGYKDASLLFPFKNNYLNNGDIIERELSHFHLYFLSTDKICEGDWFVCIKEGNFEIGLYKANNFSIYLANYLDDCFKIIATTNPECNLSKPSEQFLQVYINCFNKNEKIEECLVQMEEYYIENYGMSDGEPTTDFRLKVTKGEITIRKIKDTWNYKEHCTDMQYYMEYCERNGYVTPMDWLSKFKHY